MKFYKTELNYMPCFLSENGEVKIINYGGVIRVYKKDTFHHLSGAKKGKKYRAFGNCFIYNKLGKNEFKTYREAMKAVNGGII